VRPVLAVERRRNERVRAPQPKLLAAVASVTVALAAAAPATAHEGNPHFLSQIDRIAPQTEGLTVEVINRDDRMLLHNTSGKDVVILGYDEEHYARVLADGTVQVNADSEAYYLNDDRFADVEVPAGVDGEGAPQWKELARNGRFEWHDHRFHSMAQGTPPQVKDESVRTKVFDWSVPIEVGAERGAIAGTLFWTPLPGGGPPLAAIFAGAAIVIALCIAVVVVRYRRRTAAERPPGEKAEAW
jgi:hypothetical protein